MSLRYLFWTEWDLGLNHTKSSISRANMDGTGVQRIVHLDVAWPNGLVIDYATDRIFWIDAKLDAIDSTNLGKANLSHAMSFQVLAVSGYSSDR